ncbi:MAG TPA: preprotein translocase subunit SecG [Thermoanaerobaculia bacterium]|nr:preprotein translocase subunit SecG [Thermoanaerobaculia bacterium]
MGFLYAALIVLYTFVCLFLILVVLVQQGKGADIAGAFGGGGTQTAFGARGATTVLHKLTTGGFVAFIVVAFVLTVLEARPRASVVPAGGAPPKPAAAQIPVVPAPGSSAPAAAAPTSVAPVPTTAAPAAPTVPAKK